MSTEPTYNDVREQLAQFTPRLADFKLSLHHAMLMLDRTGRSFRVEKVPLCYMSSFPWTSTETRKIVKGEERIVHFLDAKQTVRQTDWEHIYAPGCSTCSVRQICGGLFDRGNAYDPAELSPIHVPLEHVVERIIFDPGDPSFHKFATFDEWKADFESRIAESAALREKKKQVGGDVPPPEMRIPDAPPVGFVSEQGVRLFEAKRRTEAKKAEQAGVALEKVEVQVAQILEAGPLPRKGAT